MGLVLAGLVAVAAIWVVVVGAALSAVTLGREWWGRSALHLWTRQATSLEQGSSLGFHLVGHAGSVVGGLVLVVMVAMPLPGMLRGSQVLLNRPGLVQYLWALNARPSSIEPAWFDSSCADACVALPTAVWAQRPFSFAAWVDALTKHVVEIVAALVSDGWW